MKNLFKLILSDSDLVNETLQLIKELAEYENALDKVSNDHLEYQPHSQDIENP